MKELSIEEKARAYDEALEKARQLCAYPTTKPFINDLQDLFPELKESEDERISKEIIKYLERTVPHHHRDEVLKSKEWTVWLEKQGEQNSYTGVSFKYNGHTFGMYARDGGAEILMDGNLKAFVSLDKSFVYPVTPIPVFKAENFYVSKVDGQIHDMTYNHVNNVEPKFKVGDWVFIEEIKGYKQGAFQIKSVDEFGYNFDECDAIPFKYEEFLSKWTINDTKDGEVLAEDTCTFIIKKLNRDLSAEIYCCLYDDGDFETNTTLVFDDTSTYPATKEQRNLLFQKMKEAGYEWDENNKMLKEIVEDEEESQNYKNQVMSEITDLVKHYIKQKPTCNEAGEEQLNSLQEEYKMTQEGKNMIIEELLRQKRRFELEKSTLTHNSDNYHELRGRIWAYNDAIAFINSI